MGDLPPTLRCAASDSQAFASSLLLILVAWRDCLFSRSLITRRVGASPVAHISLQSHIRTLIHIVLADAAEDGVKGWPPFHRHRRSAVGVSAQQPHDMTSMGSGIMISPPEEAMERA